MKVADINAEILEAIWTFEERGRCTVEVIKKGVDHGYVVTDEILSELEKGGLIGIHGEEVNLTEEGKDKARPIIRRHRLAERLLTDVLGMSVEDTEESACEYEHILAPGLTEAICTLLGHPAECPHGSPIPEGECCKRAEHSVMTVVKSMDAFNVGDELKISYIRTNDHMITHKLISFGISPGKTVKIRQKFPAYVIQISQAQIALEQEIAAYIYGLKI